MAEKFALAHFQKLKDATTAMTALREQGFTVYLDRDDEQMPDPDFSVSALMVGFLPDLAHGIFGTGDKKEKVEKEDAHLLVGISDRQSEEMAKSMVAELGGKYLEAKEKK